MFLGECNFKNMFLGFKDSDPDFSVRLNSVKVKGS